MIDNFRVLADLATYRQGLRDNVSLPVEPR